MHLVSHGGRCCGIRQIYGLGNDPHSITYAINGAISQPIAQEDDAINTGRVWFAGPAPAETKLSRLDRYLEYIDRHRIYGITEIVLMEPSEKTNKSMIAYYRQREKWEPHLLERGFVPVNTCFNSNSNNYITVYHRNSGEVPSADVAPEEKAKKPQAPLFARRGDEETAQPQPQKRVQVLARDAYGRFM